jgi:hypothetical protein
MTVQEIKQQIDALSYAEYLELVAMLKAQDEDAWDRQMAEDAAAGRLDFLIEEAEAERARGELRDFP